MTKKFNQGTMVSLCPDLYGRFAGQVGVLVEMAPKRRGIQWIVMIGGRVHPYYIDEEDMSLVGNC